MITITAKVGPKLTVPPVQPGNNSGAVMQKSVYDQSNINTDVFLFAQTKANAAENNAKSYADSLVVSLLDDRGNYNPSTNTNQYPTSGGSGTSGAIKKGDLWTISGLGTGVVNAIGSKTVSNGDMVRALVDSPGQTDDNWAIGENNFSFVPENASNKTSTITGNETSTTLFASIKGWIDWLKDSFLSILSSKTTLADSDTILISDSADSGKSKTISFSNFKTVLSSLFAAKSISAYSFWANNTNAIGNVSAFTFKSISKQTYSPTVNPLWTGTIPPSGATQHSYIWQQVGNAVFFELVLFYATAGSALTQVVCQFPADMPAPVKPDGISATSDIICMLVGQMSAGNTLSTLQGRAALRIDASSTSAYQLVLAQGSAGYKVAWISGSYLTS